MAFMRADVNKFSVVRESCLGQAGVIAFAMTNGVHGAGRSSWSASRRWCYRDFDAPISVRRPARIRIVAQAILSPQFEIDALEDGIQPRRSIRIEDRSAAGVGDRL